MSAYQAFFIFCSDIEHGNHDLTGLANGVASDTMISPVQHMPSVPFHDDALGQMASAPPRWTPAMGNALLESGLAANDGTASGSPEGVDFYSVHNAGTSSTVTPTDASYELSNTPSARKSSSTSSKPSVPFVKPAPAEPAAKEPKRKSRRVASQQESKQQQRKSQPQKSVEAPSSKASMDSADPKDPKRDQFLERNRIAASKCRQKKKQWVHGLEEARSDLETQHNKLQLEARSLTNQVNQMKAELMRHAQCNDPIIDSYIENEARKFVQRATERSQRHSMAMAGGPSSRLQHRSASFSLSQASQVSPTLSTVGKTPMELTDEDVVYDGFSNDVFPDGLD